MKPLILILFILAAGAASGQDKSVIKGDTLYYAGAKFYKGQVIPIAYGTRSDQMFAYVWVAGAMMGQAPAPSNLSKMEVQVTKFQKLAGNKNYLRCKLIGAPTTILIDVEGAIDKGEIAKPTR
jgi:hypothetical protein